MIKECQAYIDRSQPLQQAFFHGQTRFCNASIMYRADFLKEHLPLDDFIKYQFTLQDWNAWIILSAYTDFEIISDSTATFGIETASITRPDSVEKVKKRMDKELECYKYCCSLFPEDLQFDEKGWHSYVDSIILKTAIANGDYKNAHKLAIKLKKEGRKSLKIRAASNRVSFFLYLMYHKLTTR